MLKYISHIFWSISIIGKTVVWSHRGYAYSLYAYVLYILLCSMYLNVFAVAVKDLNGFTLINMMKRKPHSMTYDKR